MLSAQFVVALIFGLLVMLHGRGWAGCGAQCGYPLMQASQVLYAIAASLVLLGCVVVVAVRTRRGAAAAWVPVTGIVATAVLGVAAYVAGTMTL